MSQHTDGALPLACDTTAIDAVQRKRHNAVMQRLQAAVQHVRDLPDGYALQFPAEVDMFSLAAEFIALERLCCPFLTFALEVEGNSEHLWLRMTGRAGVKAFLRGELGFA